jgi:hypothetical protein
VQCTNNTKCLQLLDCVSACPQNDPYCQDDCSNAYPGGVQDLLDLLGTQSGCISVQCASACGP